MIKLLKKHNTSLIPISVASSILLGIYTPNLFGHIKFLGEIFINLLKLFALPLDRIIDRLRTAVNIFGNMCGVITVSQFLKNNTEPQEVK